MCEKVENIPAFINYKTFCELSYNVLYSIAQMFAECGYFLSKRRVNHYNGFQIYIYQFEPYYYENERICVSGTLYHMTKKEYEENILKQGFIISSQNDYANYPARNYFFKNRNLNLMKGLMYRGGKFNVINRGKNKAVLFHIDSDKLQNIHFYSDPNYWKRDEAVYCYENIPSKSIIKSETEYLTI